MIQTWEAAPNELIINSATRSDFGPPLGSLECHSFKGNREFTLRRLKTGVSLLIAEVAGASSVL